MGQLNELVATKLIVGTNHLLYLFGRGRIVILEEPCTTYHCSYVRDLPLPLLPKVARFLAWHVQNFLWDICLLRETGERLVARKAPAIKVQVNQRCGK